MSGNTKGYTFIEITVVIILMGLMASISVPKIRHAVLTDKLKSASRKIIGVVSNLRNDAIREQKSFCLHFDLEADRYWADSEAMSEEERMTAEKEAVSLPEGISLLDVWVRGKGKKQQGIVVIRFSNKGYVQESAIHLSSEDGRVFTLSLSPFLGKIKASDDYIEYEET